jgi:hypothetical protein
MLLKTLKGKGHSTTCHRMLREGVKVYLHSFLTSAPDGCGWSIPAPGKSPRTYVTRSAPGEVWTGMEERKCLAINGVGTQDSPARSEWKTVEVYLIYICQ